MERREAEQTLQEALGGWNFAGAIAGALRYGQGHINDTFCVYTQTPEGDCARYILQRINTNVFTNPQKLMENIAGITDYLRAAVAAEGGDPDRETMTVLRTKEGKLFYTDAEGGAWRCYLFVEGTVCLQTVQNPKDFYQSARAFGKFQQRLAGYPAATLHETIANFHNTPKRYEAFEKALAEDALGRAADVQAEIEFVKARRQDCGVLAGLLESGRLPLRVTHNDTKLNNVLIDKATGEGICVIDLDTVMPGLSLYDFGDSIRFGANHSAEDEQDLSKVNFSFSLYKTYTEGFLSEAGKALTPKELECLPWGAKLMTLECGIRFLTDYLVGDTYFKIHYPQQNVYRCRTQFKLVQDMEAQWQPMHEAVQQFLR
ncbi:MAG: phosphotransferase enzyme family protein [Oscillospiraceae bacterium]